MCSIVLSIIWICLFFLSFIKLGLTFPIYISVKLPITKKTTKFINKNFFKIDKTFKKIAEH